MTSLKFKTTVVLAALCLLLSASNGLAANATDQMKGTIENILSVLQDSSLKGSDKQEERRAKIREAIGKRFDFTEMAKRSLGKHWKKRSPAERKEFAELFADLIEGSYIEKIENYSDEKVIYGNEQVKNNKSKVKTKIISSKGTEISVQYKLLNRSNDYWRVYDIVVEGVSLVSNYRTQFGKALSSSSYAELVDKLRSKVN